MKLHTVAIMLMVLAEVSWADDQKTKAAVGGGVGGAVGAIVGEELGDREGAIIGSAVGAAIGTAIATNDSEAIREPSEPSAIKVEVDVSANKHPHGRHCPPGQAKKGRC